MGAAAQAIVTIILRLTLVLLRNDIAVRVWQKIASENLHGSEENKKHRRAAKRLGPKAHPSLYWHTRPSRDLASIPSDIGTPLKSADGGGCRN
jgi:hypothetical protein